MSVLLVGIGLLGIGSIGGFFFHAAIASVPPRGGDVRLTRGGHREPSVAAPPMPTTAEPKSVVPPRPAIEVHVAGQAGGASPTEAIAEALARHRRDYYAHVPKSMTTPRVVEPS